jgi:hypothetical protein
MMCLLSCRSSRSVLQLGTETRLSPLFHKNKGGDSHWITQCFINHACGCGRRAERRTL